MGSVSGPIFMHDGSSGILLLFSRQKEIMIFLFFSDQN